MLQGIVTTVVIGLVGVWLAWLGMKFEDREADSGIKMMGCGGVLVLIAIVILVVLIWSAISG